MMFASADTDTKAITAEVVKRQGEIALADPADLFEWDEDGKATLLPSSALTPGERAAFNFRVVDGKIEPHFDPSVPVRAAKDLIAHTHATAAKLQEAAEVMEDLRVCGDTIGIEMIASGIDPMTVFRRRARYLKWPEE